METDAINLALLGLRLMLGAVMLAHGINHIIGGGKIAGTARWFASLGMKPGILHAWLASLTEVGAGTMLVLGLLTPLACAGVIGVMLVALITNHWKNGFFIFRPGEGYEYVLTLSVVALCLSMLGSGDWSLDNPLGTVDLAGWSGLAVAAIAGGGGTLLLLAGFWRPPKPEPEPVEA
jgi:putative oxidoreductase